MSSNSVVKFLCFLRLLLGELVIGGVAKNEKKMNALHIKHVFCWNIVDHTYSILLVPILSTVFFKGVCLSPPINPRQFGASQWQIWATFLQNDKEYKSCITHIS